jgi:hypothetical protein
MIGNQTDSGLKEFTQPEIMDMMSQWMGAERVPGNVKIILDISDFLSVDFNDVVILGEVPYLIRNCEREGRFGIEDEPKFWVRRAVNLKDGTMKILKMVFLERFEVKIGDLAFDCARSPQKEARILELVSGHPNFMQGFGINDLSNNTVRIVDFIHGKTMSDYIIEMEWGHEEYFHKYFPSVLDEFIELVWAIKFLHRQGEKHGDIRRDHIIRDRDTGKCRWIDFDFNYFHKENVFGYDLFGLGNVLAFLTGRGDVITYQLKRDGSPVLDSLTSDDLNIVFNNRVVNLKKVYPYIPDSLNRVLLHFSTGANVFYDDTDQFLTDLQEAADKIKT